MVRIAQKRQRKLITSALPYANGDLHIGGIRSTYLPADVYARYCRLKGCDVVFACATDEHGTPIEMNAAKEKMEPEKFVEKYHERQEKDFQALGVSFDVFHHTHSDESRELSELFYERAEKRGCTFLKEVEQTFCSSCKRFLPDRYVKGACPHCKAEDQYGDGCEKCGKVYSPKDLLKPECAICGKQPTSRKVEHVFFKLSAFRKELEDFLQAQSLQKDVVHYVQNWLKDLKEWDITRDGPYFGIPIPGRKNQFFYVWFDAPIGYVAATKKWCSENNENLEDWWNEKSEIIHFIGKDIVYHHYLFWPAMLHAAGYALPKAIPTRGYLNVEGQKMSKSRGTFVLLKEVLGEVAPDVLRYYMTSITPADTTDGNFAWKDFQAKTNNELIGAYGNLVFRVLSFIERKAGGVVPRPGKYSDQDKAFEKKLEGIWNVGEKLDAIRVKEAQEELFAHASEANKYFNDRAPWKLKNQEELDTVLYLSAKAVYSLALALYPFLPFSSVEVFRQLGVPAPGKWADLSGFKPGLNVSAKPLFPRMEDELVEKQVRKLSN